MIRVWDLFVRAFHWALAASFAIAWLSSENWERLHDAIGYVAGALVALRVVWGFLGPRYARFAQFVRSPGAVIAYLRAIRDGSERRYIGHNPAGGAMIVVLLVAIAGTAVSGLAPDDRRLLGVRYHAARPFAPRARRARAGGRSPRRRGACEPTPSREPGSRHGRRRQAGRRARRLADGLSGLMTSARAFFVATDEPPTAARSTTISTSL